ncbi:gamma-glutamylcyclotransferase [soil metagenome]
MAQRIFVYGTLKRGLSNSHYLSGQSFIGEARTEPCYRMVDAGGYPGMYRVEESGLSIKGEIWEVDEVCREKLDVLEDVAAGLYAVEPIPLLAPYDDAPVNTYLYRWSIMGRLDAGDCWRE